MTNPSDTANPGDLAAQIMRLEEKLAFQQRSHEELNGVVLEQQADLERLRRECESLKKMLQGLLEGGVGEDLPHEKPPHY